MGGLGRGCLKIDHQQTGGNPPQKSPPPPPPPKKKNALFEPVVFFGFGLNKENNALMRPTLLKGPPHYRRVLTAMLTKLSSECQFPSSSFVLSNYGLE